MPQQSLGLGQGPQWGFMSEIVAGMHRADIGMVASALHRAVQGQVSLPDEFIATVKAWMESRTSQPQQQAHFAPAASPLMQQPQAVANNFRMLEQRLEDAIRRGDVQAQQAVLQQAAQLANAGQMSAGGMTPMSSPSIAGLSPGVGAWTPLFSPAPSPMVMRPMGFMTPSPSLMGHGAMTPMQLGAATPQIRGGAWPQATPSQMQAPPAFVVDAAAAAAAKQRPPALAAQSREQQEEFSPTVVPSDDEGWDFKEAPPPIRAPPKVRRAPHRPGTSEAARLIKTIGKTPAAPATSNATGAATPIVQGALTSSIKAVAPDFSPTDEAFGDDFDAAPQFEAPPLGQAVVVTAEEVAAFLRGHCGQHGDAATYQELGAHFRGSEAVRRAVEAGSELFAVEGDRVVLRDPLKKEALAKFTKEFGRKKFSRRSMEPDDALLHVHKAAELALQAYPSDVVGVLKEISKNTLRRPGLGAKGLFSAFMPLVLACLVDRIVLLERQRNESRRFENALGPVVHTIIFKRWVLGVVRGSQFLANLLLTWQRSSYFKTKHLVEPTRAMWLLIGYAGADGVADAQGKDAGTGWYKLVQREAFTPEASAICSKAARVAGQRLPGGGREGREGDLILEEGDLELGEAEAAQRKRALHAAEQMGIGLAAEGQAVKVAKREN